WSRARRLERRLAEDGVGEDSGVAGDAFCDLLAVEIDVVVEMDRPVAERGREVEARLDVASDRGEDDLRAALADEVRARGQDRAAHRPVPDEDVVPARVWGAEEEVEDLASPVGARSGGVRRPFRDYVHENVEGLREPGADLLDDLRDGTTG